MAEGEVNVGVNIEQEIAQLTAAIAEKRSQLERERGGAVESKEALHTVIAEKMQGVQVPSTKAQSSTKPQSTNLKSYLDDLDPADIQKVNVLLDMIPKQGIGKTIAMAKGEPPFILDAFHDALVDKLHTELKRKGLI